MTTKIERRPKQQPDEYFKHRYRLETWRELGAPIKDLTVRLEARVVKEHQKALQHANNLALESMYPEWRIQHAAYEKIRQHMFDQCDNCKHYFENIHAQHRLARAAERVASTAKGFPRGPLLAKLRAKAKPCPQGIWDIFIIPTEDQKGQELAVGENLMPPCICPDYREVVLAIQTE